MNLSDIMDVNIEAEAVHIANKKWWVDLVTGKALVRNKHIQVMLIVTEYAEAMEGWRKDLWDDHLPQYKMEYVEIIDAFIRLLDYRYGHNIRTPFHYLDMPFLTQEYEPAWYMLANINGLSKIYVNDAEFEDRIDVCINQCFWYAQIRGFENIFLQIYSDKMAYNATRVDHTTAHRLSEHGKKH